MWNKTVDHVCIDDLFAAQLRAAKAEGELAAIKDELRKLAGENGLNPEADACEIIAKASGLLRSRARLCDIRFNEMQEMEVELDRLRCAEEEHDMESWEGDEK